MSFARVLSRDRDGRAVLWQCSDCGEPFNSGWGSRCNRCDISEIRHQQLVAALRGIADGKQ